MIDAILAVVLIGLWFFGIIDCARTNQDSVRSLPKWAWLLILIVFQSLGAIAWLIAGRPKATATGKVKSRRSGKRIIPPDDNPDFLSKL